MPFRCAIIFDLVSMLTYTASVIDAGRRHRSLGRKQGLVTVGTASSMSTGLFPSVPQPRALGGYTEGVALHTAGFVTLLISSKPSWPLSKRHITMSLEVVSGMGG